jgi:hypothetical protein
LAGTVTAGLHTSRDSFYHTAGDQSRKSDIVDVVRMAGDDSCEYGMLVQIRWQGRKMAVPLSQLEAIGADESTQEAVGDWHYWVAQGYCL